jgi:hypothetical protein
MVLKSQRTKPSLLKHLYNLCQQNKTALGGFTLGGFNKFYFTYNPQKHLPSFAISSY